jgi:hypothetical protein
MRSEVLLAGCMLCWIVFCPTVFAGERGYNPNESQRMPYDSQLEADIANNKERAREAREKEIDRLKENRDIAREDIKNTDREIQKYEKIHRDAMNEVLEQNTGVPLTGPKYMDAPEIKNYVPSDSEVLRDLDPLIRATDAHNNIQRLKNDKDAMEQIRDQSERDLKVLENDGR